MNRSSEVLVDLNEAQDDIKKFTERLKTLGHTSSVGIK